MEKDMAYIRQLVEKYKAEVEPLLQYIPWLTENIGNKTDSLYAGDGIQEHSVPIPVYHGTLMNFIRAVQKTKLLDRNYVYVYTRNHIRTVEDEKRFIEKATIRDMEALSGILAKYVMGGLTKGYLWPQGVEEGVFLEVLLKMKYIIEYWDKPLTV